MPKVTVLFRTIVCHRKYDGIYFFTLDAWPNKVCHLEILCWGSSEIRYCKITRFTTQAFGSDDFFIWNIKV